MSACCTGLLFSLALNTLGHPGLFLQLGLWQFGDSGAGLGAQGWSIASAEPGLGSHCRLGYGVGGWVFEARSAFSCTHTPKEIFGASNASVLSHSPGDRHWTPILYHTFSLVMVLGTDLNLASANSSHRLHLSGISAELQHL